MFFWFLFGNPKVSKLRHFMVDLTPEDRTFGESHREGGEGAI